MMGTASGQAALRHISGTATDDDRTPQDMLHDPQWSGFGIAQKVHAVALAAYDLIIGLELDDVSDLRNLGQDHS